MPISLPVSPGGAAFLVPPGFPPQREQSWTSDLVHAQEFLCYLCELTLASASRELPGFSWLELLILSELVLGRPFMLPEDPLQRRPSAGKLLQRFRWAMRKICQGFSSWLSILGNHTASLACLRPLAISSGYAATSFSFPLDVGMHREVSIAILRHQGPLSRGEEGMFRDGVLTRPAAPFKPRSLPGWRRGVTLSQLPPRVGPGPSHPGGPSPTPGHGYSFRCPTKGCTHVHLVLSRPVPGRDSRGHRRWPTAR